MEALIRHGISTLFGYPGGCVIPLFDELLNYPELRMILVRHEQGATHAADGLARVTGKPQVCLVTSGPGATNCVTGLATAMMDSSPLIVISGQVRRAVIGTDAFQETNVIGVSRPVTKHNYLVSKIEDLQPVLIEAFQIAAGGRPGPVLIDVPVDLQKETTALAPWTKRKIRGFDAARVSSDPDAASAWGMISQAKRPVIYAGGGIFISKASPELNEFSSKTGIPVATTLLGQGCVNETSTDCLGMLGMHGTYAANMAMVHCDLAIALGARFDDRVTGDVDEFLKDAEIIHVDIDPSSLDKVKKADLPIHSDVKDFLRKIIPLATKLDLEPWKRQLRNFDAESPVPNFNEVATEENKLRPEYVIAELSRISEGEAVVVTDVGQHQMFTCLHYCFKNPQSHVTSGGLGTMGFSLPAALGIAAEFPEKTVISVSGDGGFQMNMQELATIRTYNVNVKIVIINNGNLGMVKQWQDIFWNNRYSSVIFDQNPDFVALGKSFDIPSHSVGAKEKVPGMIRKMLDEEGPFILEFKVEKDAHVYPMVPSGAPLRDIILSETS